MKNIYLIGFMGVGKSTFGKKLARELGFGFTDLDALFEEKYKVSIDTFFTKYDESLFRKLENELLTETFSLENTVVATGGGTPCFFNAMEAINAHGLSVYLKMNPAAIAHRLTHARKPRPLVKNKTGEELLSEIRKRLAERSRFYEQAQLTVDALHADAGTVARQIREML